MAVRGRPWRDGRERDAGDGEGVDGTDLRGKARGVAASTAWTSLQAKLAQGRDARGATSSAGPGLEKPGAPRRKLFSPGVSTMSTQSLVSASATPPVTPFPPANDGEDGDGNGKVEGAPRGDSTHGHGTSAGGGEGIGRLAPPEEGARPEVEVDSLPQRNTIYKFLILY
jgi:hypothetical protein